MTVSDISLLKKPTNPVIFTILMLPFGIISSYVTTTLVYLFSKAGISVEAVAGLAAVSLIPQIFRFLWAPLIDTIFTVKKWYLAGTVLSALCMIIMAVIPIKAASIGLMLIAIFVANCVVSFSSMSVACFAAHDTPEDAKGKAGGFLSAGNVGGMAVGGGLGLWLAQRLPAPWMTGAALGFICLLCCIGVLFVTEPVYTVKARSLAKTVKNLRNDVWGILKSRVGLLVLFLSIIPLGVGGASNIFAAIGIEWHASADTIALITGVLGGIVSTIGCVAGGWICDMMDRRLSYVLFGLLQGIAAVGMAFFAHTPLMFIIWTGLYNFTLGLTYTAISAFILEAIGKGAATTKFEIYMSLSNAPIYLMTLILGWAHTKWGASGMLNFEAVVDVAAAVLFFIAQAMLINRKNLVIATVD
jgi:PAT family beta-lactamase induction signal transducer AmpG